MVPSLRDLAHLQSLAINNLESASQPATKAVKNGDEKNAVWIPTGKLNSKEDRKRLHQCTREAFTLLKTETFTPNAEEVSGDADFTSTCGVALHATANPR